MTQGEIGRRGRRGGLGLVIVFEKEGLGELCKRAGFVIFVHGVYCLCLYAADAIEPPRKCNNAFGQYGFHRAFRCQLSYYPIAKDVEIGLFFGAYEVLTCQKAVFYGVSGDDGLSFLCARAG